MWPDDIEAEFQQLRRSPGYEEIRNLAKKASGVKARKWSEFTQGEKDAYARWILTPTEPGCSIVRTVRPL